MKRRWTCTTCAVTSRRLDGKATPMPEGWGDDGAGIACLSCRRESVIVTATAGRSGSEAGSARREALVRFELLRGLTIREAAKAANAPARVAEAASAELHATGQLPKAKVKPKPKPAQRPKPVKHAKARRSYPDRYPRLAAELLADPRRSNRQVAIAADLQAPSVHAARAIVGHVRRALEREGRIEKFRADPWTERRAA